MKKPPAALAKKMQEAPRPAPSSDKLEAVRDVLRASRDADAEIADLEARLKALGKEQLTRIHETLPALFQEIGIDKLGLEPEGNLPAYDASMGAYYKASIPADWPPEQQDAAFDWLEKAGHGDLVKNTFVIQLGRGEEEKAKRLAKLLDGAKFDYENKRAVPWNSLTAFVKEQVEEHSFTPPLDLLGATVGKIVRLKPRKEKK